MKFKKGDFLKHPKYFICEVIGEDKIDIPIFYILKILTGPMKDSTIIRTIGPVDKYFFKIENQKTARILYGKL